MGDWPPLHVRRAAPWVAIGAVLIGVFVVLPMLVDPGEGSRAEQWLGLMLWLVFIPGLFAVGRGLLTLISEFDTRHAVRLAALAFGGMVVSVLLHNLVSGLFDVEEGVFFALALFVFPPLLVAAGIRAFRPRSAPATAPARPKGARAKRRSAR
ncbi:MAG: hypothetical protein ACKVVT_02905 [Dehalococcoidia bacterium]